MQQNKSCIVPHTVKKNTAGGEIRRRKKRGSPPILVQLRGTSATRTLSKTRRDIKVAREMLKHIQPL